MCFCCSAVASEKKWERKSEKNWDKKKKFFVFFVCNENQMKKKICGRPMTLTVNMKKGGGKRKNNNKYVYGRERKRKPFGAAALTGSK